jgi:hypothetical protein
MVGMCTTGALKALIYIAEPQAKGATYLFDAFFLFSIEKNLEDLKKNLEKRNPVN